MKRGLKDISNGPNNFIYTGYNHCPDEKGTESPLRTWRTSDCTGYNHCPDEKGTESQTAADSIVCWLVVTTIAPMKRGLKDTVDSGLFCLGNCYNHCPDEKGTESNVTPSGSKSSIKCYNHCPDEKGTES